MRDDLVERLFSLFTSSDCAEAIAGDLIQERPGHRASWFWCQAFAAAATLWGADVAKAPLRTLLVAAAGCALIAVPMFAGVAAVSLFPTLLGAVVAWGLLAIIWWGGALWAGAAMVAIAPTRGMPACVTLAAVGEAVLLAAWLLEVRIDAVTVVTAAAAAWPLLIGAAVARARAIPWTDDMLERQW
jgi:hypothetical protein